MSLLRQYAFLSVISRRLFVAKHYRSKLNCGWALMHQSRICLDGQTIEIKMPSLSPTMTEGTIVKWLKSEGDTISPGDVLCEIQTDKAVVGLETEEEGVLIKILIPENTQNIKLGKVIAVISVDGGDGATIKTVQASVPDSSDLTNKSSVHHKVPHEDGLRLCGPSVRKLLQEYGIEYQLITSTGPHNNLLKGDVLNYITSNNLKKQVFAVEKSADQKQKFELPKAPDVTFIEKPFVDIPVTSMRRTIARRLTESKTTIPHAYVSIDCKIEKILEYRKELKKDGINVSLNDFVIKSAAVALSKTPNVNVIYINGQAKSMQSVDISVAVATENGLITPIVKRADTLSIQNISEEVKSLAVKAREGKLKPEEFQGGSFTISNLGMFGISEFSAVINPPQGAILAVGSSRFVVEDSHPVQRMRVTLSYDNRVITNDEAGSFLQKFQMYLENPLHIIL